MCGGGALPHHERERNQAFTPVNSRNFDPMITFVALICIFAIASCTVQAYTLKSNGVASCKEFKHIYIIGGGWAGFGAAHAILTAARFDDSKDKIKVTILEGSPQPGGLASGWKSANGKSVEAGIHGFWRCYSNIERLITRDLRLVDEKSPFTDWTPSALWTKDGLSVVSPVFGDRPNLPTPLGTALFPRFYQFNPLDMLTAIPLVLPWFDFDGSKPSSWLRYDKMTARELFSKYGMSETLYDQFIEPLLLVLPMCPGEDCSAAAALSLFSYFALEHQSDFDVKWLRGSATELIFTPWRKHLEDLGGVVLNEKKVSRIITMEEGSTSNINAKAAVGDDLGKKLTAKIISIETLDGSKFDDVDAVISCTGISAAQAIIKSNPTSLSNRPDFAAILRLKAVDVVAVRIWLKKKISLPHSSNVGGGGMIPGLETTGFTYYDVTALQDKMEGQEHGQGQVHHDKEKKQEGKTGSESKIDNYSNNDGNMVKTVLEVDFYYAQTLVGQDDKTVLKQAINTLRNADPETFKTLNVDEDIEDFVVVKIPRAVSHFAPGTFVSLPTTKTSIDNFYFAGDWVDRGGHKSWSQEKALVTGYQAAQSALNDLFGSKMAGRATRILEVQPSEPHIAIGRALFGGMRDQLQRIRTSSPLRKR